MEIVGKLQKQFIDFINALYHEGFLDDQFLQLQKLQDESSPDFVVEVVTLFFEDSEEIINNLAATLQQQAVDFKQVDSHVHQFKGSSSSVGAQRVTNACIAFRNFCEQKNLEGCVQCLQHVKHEYFLVKNKLETLLRISDFEFSSTRRVWFSSSLASLKAFDSLKSPFFRNKLEQQILAAGGTIPVLS